MKILRILTRLGAGGPPIHCLTANRELTARGHDCQLLVGECGPADEDMSYLIGPSDRIRRIPELTPRLHPWNDVRALWRLSRILREERPDIVHTHTARAGALGRVAALLARVPVCVHTFHGHVLRGYFSRAVSEAFRWIEKMLGLATDGICVLSPSQAAELESLGVAPRAKFHVVPLGMDLSSFGSLPDAPERPFTVAWLGRMVPVKNLELLRQVIEQMPDVRFLIAGDGPDRWWLGGLPNVEMLGWVEDVHSVLARSHAVVMTSRNEGTPVALIQAMAAGRPFVSTPAGGVPDLAGGGRHGIVCAPRAELIAESLNRLRVNEALRRRMSEAARHHALEFFSEQAMTDRLERLYGALAAQAYTGRRRDGHLSEARPAAGGGRE